MRRYFIRNIGGYYDFMAESVLGLYERMEREDALESRDCEIWYAGNFVELLQLFTRLPVRQVKSSKEAPQGVEHVEQGRPESSEAIHRFRPLFRYITRSVPISECRSGATIIRRSKRAYKGTQGLERALKDRGIYVRTVSLEALSLPDQINIMRSTELLIAPHGAGLVNMGYMPKGSIVVELLPRAVDCPVFPWLADALGHQLVAIEAVVPSVTGRIGSDVIMQQIKTVGWPTVEESRSWPDFELQRYVRRIDEFEIDPVFVVSIIDAIKRFRVASGQYIPPKS